jgi:hypothetical protein
MDLPQFYFLQRFIYLGFWQLLTEKITTCQNQWPFLGL